MWRKFLCAMFAGCVCCAGQCVAPPELEKAVKQHANVATYSALGAYFAQKQQLDCAIPAFEQAVKLAPESREAHFNFGLALMAHNLPDKAAEQFRQAIKYKSDWVEAHNALGSALESQGRPDEAEAEFKKALQLNPRSAETLTRLGELYSSERRYSAAIDKLSRAGELAPTDSDLKIELAVACSNNGDSARAIAILSQLIQATNTNLSSATMARAHFNLGTVYANDKRFREAADEYGADLKWEPDNDIARLSLVKSYATIANYQAALPEAVKYVARRPQDYEGHYLLGNVYRGLAQYADAERELKNAVSGEDDYGPNYDLGFVLNKEDKPDEALVYLRRALQLRPNSAEAHFQLAAVLKALHLPAEAGKEMEAVRQEKQQSTNESIAAASGSDANRLLSQGDAQTAADRYRKALELDPMNAKTWFNLSIALGALGQHKDQRNALEKALEYDSSLSRAHNALGLLDAQDGNTAQAEDEFKKAISLDAQFAEAQSNLGTLYGRTGRMQEAEGLLRKAIENDSTLVEAALNLGLILASRGQWAEAETQLKSAVALSPRNATAIKALGMVEAKLQKPELSIHQFQTAVSLQPNSAEAHLNLGIALADHYQMNRALEEFTEAERLSPEAAAPRYNRGRLLVDLNRYSEAVPELQLACRRNTKFAPPFYLLGLCQTKLGNDGAALQSFGTFLGLEPANADAYFLAGQDLQRLGRTAEAIDDWKKAVKVDPNQTEALYSLWRALAKANSPEAGSFGERFKLAQKEKQISSQVGMLGNFALASANRGDYQQAISQFGQALKECGDCQSRADLLKDLGLIECKSGQLKQGKQDLMTARLLKPNDPDIEKALNIVTRSMQSP